jgi:hypothetical protein
MKRAQILQPVLVFLMSVRVGDTVRHLSDTAAAMRICAETAPRIARWA